MCPVIISQLKIRVLTALFVFCGYLALAACHPQTVQTSHIAPKDEQLLADAQAGDAVAQFIMGVNHFIGDRAEQSDAMAFDWYRKAAIQGHEQAQLNLATMYLNGWGNIRDEKSALFWLMASKALGSREADEKLGEAWPGHQKPLAYPEVGMLKRAFGGSADAQRYMATRYRHGVYIASDGYKALYLYSLAADQNDAQAKHHIGMMLRAGEGVPRDVAAAAKWTEQAARQGLMAAQHELGHLYGLGTGVPLDIDLARHWYGKAAAQGYSASKFFLQMLDQTI